MDLVNNIDELAEDHDLVLNKALAKALQLPYLKVRNAVAKYGSVKTKKIFKKVLNKEKAYA